MTTTPDDIGRDKAEELRVAGPLVERAVSAERKVYVTVHALKKVVDAYDGFVSEDSLEPLMEAIKNARSLVQVYDSVLTKKEKS